MSERDLAKSEEEVLTIAAETEEQCEKGIKYSNHDRTTYDAQLTKKKPSLQQCELNHHHSFLPTCLGSKYTCPASHQKGLSGVETNSHFVSFICNYFTLTPSKNILTPYTDEKKILCD